MSLTKEQWLREAGGFPLKNVLFAHLAIVPRPLTASPRNRVYLDIETAPIRMKFRHAKTDRQRVRQAPDPSIACIYSPESSKFSFFRRSQFRTLLRILRASDEVITFNGESFDFYVIANVLKLKIDQLRIKKSTDLFRVIRDACKVSTSLKNLALVNFGENKHTAGDIIPNLEMAEIKKACRSDVRQLRALHRLYRTGKLKAPIISLTSRHHRQMFLHGTCPICKDAASIVEIPSNTSDMTEGQEMDFIANRLGTFRCTTCNTSFFRESE